MLRHAKSPSKYTSLQRLREIQANHYCGRDGQDYEASEVDRLIAAKADAVSDDAIEAWLDYNEQLSAHEAELEAEYFADMDSTLLESTPIETGDGSISAAACAPWTTLVIEYTTALVHRAWGFFSKGKKSLMGYIESFSTKKFPTGTNTMFFDGVEVTNVAVDFAVKHNIDLRRSTFENTSFYYVFDSDGKKVWADKATARSALSMLKKFVATRSEP
jgi:hypothetical protein